VGRNIYTSCLSIRFFCCLGFLHDGLDFRVLSDRPESLGSGQLETLETRSVGNTTRPKHRPKFSDVSRGSILVEHIFPDMETNNLDNHERSGPYAWVSDTEHILMVNELALDREWGLGNIWCLNDLAWYGSET
jgi:hypothetical protein